MSHAVPAPALPLAYLERPPRQQAAHAPLLMLLHGVGSNERDLFRLAPALDGRFRVLSVRAPLVRAEGSYAWFVPTFTATGIQIDPAELDASRKTLITFIESAVRAFAAEPERVYLLGFSQGAIMSLTLALTEPERLAAVVAIAGRIPPEVLPWAAPPERTTRLPLLLEHGRQDTVLPITWAHAARPILEAQRLALDYREYDAPHTITDHMLADAAAWLSARLDESTSGNEG
jgi:phospholipase/carboxylesterase